MQTLLVVILGLACGGAFGWALWLRRQLRARRTSPPIDRLAIPPLVHSVASTLDSGLIVLDAERQVRYLNPQAEDLLGLSAESAIGSGLITLLRDYQVDALVGEVMRDHESREMVVHQHGGGRTLQVRANALKDTYDGGAALLVRDVTQMSLLERARRDMVANVSHELRTPLASIKLLVETLQSSPPPQVAQRMLVQTAQEVDAVTQLVDELHELSQIESGRVKLQMEMASLAPVVARALDRIRPQAERKLVRVSAFVPDRLPPAMIDTQRIGQVLLNLLHNAVKFTASGDTVTVRAMVITLGSESLHTGYIERRLERMLVPEDRRRSQVPLAKQGRPEVHLPQPLAPGDWLLVSVADTGIGIPQRDLPRIFERFYKVDRARTRNAGGTGLGLAIAKHLVEGHGGRIWATSAEGEGSTFYLVLPIASDGFFEDELA
ncbi:cell wall metabolism sensor histidine kinase WalK [Chloroflexia bacterium SDU3-3]|nr:cell wall metabolism sensor histidine kinase WalK [Chloroflexia bacterium SDU3-3]